MNNHQAIRDNVKSGDILVCRKRFTPITTISDGVVKTNWDNSFLYLNNDKILDGIDLQNLDYCLNIEYDAALFRVKFELTTRETSKLLLVVKTWRLLYKTWRNILGIFKKPYIVTQCELIAKAYYRVNRQIKQLPFKQIKPIDFDDSPITVRIV